MRILVHANAPSIPTGYGVQCKYLVDRLAEAGHEVAVSCTGVGEYFILGATAYDVAARLRYGGQSLDEACQGAIARIGELGGDGGLIAVNRQGRVSFQFNSPGLKRAVAGSGQVAMAMI